MYKKSFFSEYDHVEDSVKENGDRATFDQTASLTAYSRSISAL